MFPGTKRIHLREGGRCVGGREFVGGGLYYYTRPSKSATSKLIDKTDNAPVIFDVKEQPPLPLDAEGKARRRAHQSLSASANRNENIRHSCIDTIDEPSGTLESADHPREALRITFGFRYHALMTCVPSFCVCRRLPSCLIAIIIDH